MVTSAWEHIKGHAEQKKVLKHSVLKNNTPPFMIFNGPSGIGKKTLALALAQALNCEGSQFCCGVCPSCIRIHGQQSESLYYIQPDSQQIKIDSIRELRNKLQYKQYSKAFVVIIDQAEKLNPQSSNALLKTLEEPNPQTYFILVCGNKNALLETIRSRAQMIHFSPLKIEELKQICDAPEWVLQSAMGRMNFVENLRKPEEMEFRRDVLQLFFSAGKVKKYQAFAEIKNLSKDKSQCLMLIRYWQTVLRDCLYLSYGSHEIINADFIDQIQDFSQIGKENLEQLSQLSLKLEQEQSYNVDRNLLLENFWLTSSSMCSQNQEL